MAETTTTIMIHISTAEATTILSTGACLCLDLKTGLLMKTRLQIR